MNMTLKKQKFNDMNVHVFTNTAALNPGDQLYFFSGERSYTDTFGDATVDAAQPPTAKAKAGGRGAGRGSRSGKGAGRA